MLILLAIYGGVESIASKGAHSRTRNASALQTIRMAALSHSVGQMLPLNRTRTSDCIALFASIYIPGNPMLHH